MQLRASPRRPRAPGLANRSLLCRVTAQRPLSPGGAPFGCLPAPTDRYPWQSFPHAVNDRCRAAFFQYGIWPISRDQRFENVDDRLSRAHAGSSRGRHANLDRPEQFCHSLGRAFRAMVETGATFTQPVTHTQKWRRKGDLKQLVMSYAGGLKIRYSMIGASGNIEGNQQDN